MSEIKPSSQYESLTLQNPESNIIQSKQTFQRQISPEEINQDGNGQKKQQDNDYECQFKLVVKQKFQEKLKNDSTNQFFTIIINEIIEERVKRNFVAVSDEGVSPQKQAKTEVNQPQQENKKKSKGPSQLERLKAEDQEVKKRIQQLMKKRPKKKALTTYELDPNRDKGFILAKRMNEMKQQRQKKFIELKKQSEEKKKSLIQNQFATISCVENYSMFLAKKANSYRRFRKQSQDLQLPKINLGKKIRSDTDTMRDSKNGFYDFLSQSRASTQKQISEDEKSINLSTKRYESIALSSKSAYDSKSKDRRRNLPRQIQILKRSQKITQKYQLRKIMYDILVDVIFNSVKIVEKKKQFFGGAPPKPVHQMIGNLKENNGKIAQTKKQKFRININLKEVKNTKNTTQNNQPTDSEIKSEIQNQSRVSKISQIFSICLKNKQDQQKSEHEKGKSCKNQSEVKSVFEESQVQEEERASQIQQGEQNAENYSQKVESDQENNEKNLQVTEQGYS